MRRGKRIGEPKPVILDVERIHSFSVVPSPQGMAIGARMTLKSAPTLKLYSCWDIFVAAPDEKTARRLAVPTLKETFKAHSENDEIRAHCADTGVYEVTEPIQWEDGKQEIMRRPEEIIALSGGAEGVCGIGFDLWW